MQNVKCPVLNKSLVEKNVFCPSLSSSDIVADFDTCQLKVLLLVTVTATANQHWMRKNSNPSEL
jgi:hypothetical protein